MLSNGSNEPFPTEFPTAANGLLPLETVRNRYNKMANKPLETVGSRWKYWVYFAV